MASNVAPIYDSQDIRYAETHEVSPAEVFELRLLAYNVTTGEKEIQSGPSSATLVTLGVNQFYIPDATFAPEASRLATVANSGRLIVEADPLNIPGEGTPLLVDAVGRASSAGGAVEVDGKVPTIRSICQAGGRTTVKVSFG